MTPSCAQAAALPPLATAAGGRHCSTRSALWIFLPPSYSLDGRLDGPTPFVGLLASAPRCAATSLLLRSCTVVLTIKRWDAPGPAALTLRSTIMVADWCLRRPGCILPLPPSETRTFVHIEGFDRLPRPPCHLASRKIRCRPLPLQLLTRRPRS